MKADVVSMVSRYFPRQSCCLKLDNNQLRLHSVKVNEAILLNFLCLWSGFTLSQQVFSKSDGMLVNIQSLWIFVCFYKAIFFLFFSLLQTVLKCFFLLLGHVYRILFPSSTCLFFCSFSGITSSFCRELWPLNADISQFSGLCFCVKDSMITLEHTHILLRRITLTLDCFVGGWRFIVNVG